MVEHFLTILRDRATGRQTFREAAKKLSLLIASDLARQLKFEKTSVRTPLGLSPGRVLSQKIVIVPILRAGQVLLPAFEEIFEGASIGFLGIRRDEGTARPHLYYENLPPLSPTDSIFLLDPMLATGGTANLALDRLEAHGANLARTTLVSILAAKEGVRAIEKRVTIYTVAIDAKLNAQKFIVPGLGDFGDRYFGTN